MSCQRCGRRANGRLCRDCERDEKFGNADADQSQPDRGDLLHECTECNTEYETDGSDDCPNCGSSRRRYVGDETKQAAGHREVYCPTHPDARIKARTRNDMVGCPVTIYRCFVCGDELTPRPAKAPTERVATDGGVDVDGGRQAFLAGDAHYCDICDRQFQTLVELIKHDCEQSGAGRTNRGPDPAAYAEWEESR